MVLLPPVNRRIEEYDEFKGSPTQSKREDGGIGGIDTSVYAQLGLPALILRPARHTILAGDALRPD